MSYQRKRDDKHRLKKLYEETYKHSHGVAGAWYNPKKHRYVRIVSSNKPGLAKSLRRLSNKRIRRCCDVADGCAYRKMSKYENMLW